MVTSKNEKVADNNGMFNMNGFCINDVAACLLCNRNILF